MLLSQKSIKRASVDHQQFAVVAVAALIGFISIVNVITALR
jgi:hypothetical protein